ncbi:MAG: transporter permease [Ilumatobacteraceae bacterium]|nr:transporter permease [Ilumatobacteraceae bacterium]
MSTPTEVYHEAQMAVGRSLEQIKRSRNLGIVYLLLAAITAWRLTSHAGTATFNLSGGHSFGVAATPLAWVVAGSLAVMGGVQLARGLGKWQTAALAAVAVVFIFTLLAWAAAPSSFAFVGMLSQGVTYSAPLIFGAMAGIMCERSGVVNIAIEGLLLSGAFTSALVGSVVNFWVGVAAAMVVGALFAWFLAWLAIRFKVDQVIVGFFINFFVLGLTSFLGNRILAVDEAYNQVRTLVPWKIPGLHSIPVIGPILFEQTVFVYIAFALVAFLAWAFAKTRWGLRTRAIGEHPRAADTLGVNVNQLRYRNVIAAGAVAGFGGSWWTANVGRFNENITNGRGFIALAVVIVGRWSPAGALAGALVFGFFDAMEAKLSFLNTGIPGEFVQMLPYLATIIVVAGFVGRSRAPRAAGQAYDSQ